MAGPSLFDFLGAVNNSKEDLLRTDDPDVLKAFEPFMLRRGLAQSKDTLVIAQKMNLIHGASDWMQWNLALHTIPARKRYDKWSKKGALDPDVELLSRYFYISREKASEYLKFLPAAALAEIREKVSNMESNDKAKPRKAAKAK